VILGVIVTLGVAVTLGVLVTVGVTVGVGLGEVPGGVVIDTSPSTTQS
jgi:hypothetical protein